MQLTSPTRARAEQIVRLARLTMVSEREGDIHTLALDGEIDLANAGEVEQELRRVEATDVDVILVDLGGVSFIDSTGMKVFVMAAIRSNEHNRLVLQRAGPGVLRV
ncbi:MAG: STAS domain-containing protein, partial [Actinomycetota bacterium]|nr:STAS domain-containing protein [Actinomycetota bacterium]